MSTDSSIFLEYEHSFNFEGRKDELEIGRRMYLNITMHETEGIRIRTFEGKIVKAIEDPKYITSKRKVEFLILPEYSEDIVLCKWYTEKRLKLKGVPAVNILVRVCDVIDEDEVVKTEKFVVGDDKEPSCPICWNKLLSGHYCAVTPCFHIFHCECLASWLGISEEHGCPICRKRISYFYHDTAFDPLKL